jgi:cold shock CspA family protein
MPKPTTTAKPKPPRGNDASISRGRIQRIYVERGFGFIRCTEGASDDIGQDFFFHHSGLAADCRITDLQEGSLVSFEPTYVPKGKRAEHIAIDDGEGE